MTIYDVLQEEIKVLNRELRSEEETVEILKKRLTKKEFKYLLMKKEGFSYDIIAKELNVEGERLTEIAKHLTKKLNSEKLKHELSIKA